MAVRQPAVGPAAAHLATLSLAPGAGGVGGGLEAFFTASFHWCSIKKPKWVWVNTYRYIFSEMNIHKSQLFWGSLGTRVLTHPQMI